MKSLSKILLLTIITFLSFPVISHAQNRSSLELMSFELNRIAGVETINSIAALDQGQKFLDSLNSSETWLTDLLDSGPVQNPKRILTMLHRIWLQDNYIANDDLKRSFATACSLAMGMNTRLDEDWMFNRYQYFLDSWDNGRLNKCFSDLATWERRYIARGPQYSSYSSVESLKYLQQRICLPRKDYVGACWQAPYRGHNCFGDSVQGPKYYQPFRGSFSCDPEMAITVGGVCGALSNLGTAAAIANGIPATSMGEPGHCAYAVNTAPGIWTPAYSLSWKRGMHTSFYRGTWTDLMLAQACFEKPDLVHKAANLQRLAHWNESLGNIKDADLALAQAIKTHPMHYAIWIDRAEFAIRHKFDAKWWKAYHDDILELLAPAHEEPAWHLLSKYVYDNLTTKMSNAARTEIFLQYLKSFDDFGAGRWNIESAWSWMTGKAGGSSTQRKFLRQLADATITSPGLGAACLAWVKNYYEKDDRQWLEFQNWLVARLDSNGDGADSIIRQLGRTAMPAAAKRGDLASYQAIGKLCSRLYKSTDTKGIDPFPGELLTEGGAMNISGIGEHYDSPEQHWGVLNMHGGALHTNTTTTPWVEVKLGNFGLLNGIVIQNRPGGFMSRANGARVLVSTDGQDWQQVGKLEGAKLFYRIDLSQTKPQAGYLRIERDGQCMHFARILAYGQRTN
ncbi:MAG: discoidin domain-containing protein [Phycisphaerae bacterium]|nr:discoidin domain-containing protein [Phycisphaerae bacterium]